jgi:hypothetical protein
VVEAQFVTSANDAVVGPPSDLANVLSNLNMVFTIIFAIELLINLCANWFLPFFKSGWNIVDLIVVVLSLAALGPIDLPITVLRMMRAFRVIRLFGRIKALKKMIAACVASVVPMMNAFLIMTILASICTWDSSRQPASARCARSHHVFLFTTYFGNFSYSYSHS